MDFDLMFPSRFLKSGEFQGRDVTLTMTGIFKEELPLDGGGTKEKGIIGFKETKKQLVLNRTNGECIKAMFGRETDNWIGKRITFYPAEYQGETAIRVRGSPELSAPKKIEIKLPRKRPYSVVLQATAKKQAQQQQQAQQQAQQQNSAVAMTPAPDFMPFDSETGEVPVARA